eukprot:2588896-Amphidinium_carterae.1
MEIHFANENEVDVYLSDFRQKEILADAGHKSRVYCQPSLPKSLAVYHRSEGERQPRTFVLVTNCHHLLRTWLKI